MLHIGLELLNLVTSAKWDVSRRIDWAANFKDWLMFCRERTLYISRFRIKVYLEFRKKWCLILWLYHELLLPGTLRFDLLERRLDLFVVTAKNPKLGLLKSQRCFNPSLVSLRGCMHPALIFLRRHLDLITIQWNQNCCLFGSRCCEQNRATPLRWCWNLWWLKMLNR